tara:strand:- start:1054 stop:1236 length:183 start_codon:yes stop_codon:yes gene_type:complete
MDRAAEARKATVAMATTAANRTAVESTVTTKATTVAMVAATDDSACGTRHRRTVKQLPGR